MSDQELHCERESMRLCRRAREDLERAAKLTGICGEDIELAIQCLMNESCWEHRISERRSET